MKLNGLSLFSNVGIAEIYLKQIGVEITLANEILERRAKFYQENYPSYFALFACEANNKKTIEVEWSDDPNKKIS